MYPPDWIEEGLGEREYLQRVTELLMHARADEPQGGPWDAADLQWWSRSRHYDDPDRLRFWSAPNSPSCVCALFPTVGGRIAFNALWTRSARDTALQWILPPLLSNVQSIARDGRLSIETEVLETDTEWRRLLERRGFTRAPGGSVQAALRTSDVVDLPWAISGLRVCDDTQRAPDEPHPLERRCGAEIHERLLGCSLYRPDLDLSVRSEDGEVVAYCICWADRTNRFAMLEPMRTEPAWQRRGLGSALIAEQIRRLIGLGIEDLKVNYATNNPAAQRLYARAKFVRRFERVVYQWVAPDDDASG